MTMTRCLLVVLLCAGLAAGTGLAAERDRLAQARHQYLSQEYERVIKLLTPLVNSPAATIADKVEAYELLGLSYLILGETPSAREAFENLLGLDPAHVLHDPSGSPKLQRFFESVKARFVPGYQSRSPVTLEHAAPTSAVAGRMVELAVLVSQGKQAVAEVQLRWRRSGLLSYDMIRFQRRGQSLSCSFALPADPTGYRLEYYIEARDSSSQVLTRLGSPEQPLGLEVAGRAASHGEPFYKRWWFWTIVGGVVVGAATTGAVLGSRKSAPSGNLPPGVWQLP